jgi:molybdopterin converting factor small subunit
MSINVKIRLLGSYRGLLKKGLISLTLEHPTVREAIKTLALSLPLETKKLLIDPELNDPRPNALILVNGKEVSALEGLETRIKQDDELTLIPISHGG